MGSHSVDPSPVGRVGVLIQPTRGADGPGEVRIAIRGGTELFTAYSLEPIPHNATVLVIGHRFPRVLDVERWEDTLLGAPPATA